MSKNLSLLSSRKGWDSRLFGSITEAANNPDTKDEQLKLIAEDFMIGSANVLGALSFYDHLKPEHQSKKVFICNGTACLVSGTQPHVRKRLNGQFKDHEIGEMCCLGRCHENSAFQYQGVNYSGSDIIQIDDIVSGKVDYSTVSFLARTALKESVLINDYGFDHHKELYESLLGRDKLDLLEQIKRSNLRGRGGAGFLAGRKLEICRMKGESPKFVICNADEGDPGSYSDRYLLERQPHSVWLGILIAAMVTGAEYAIAYIRAEYPESIKIMEKAMVKWTEFLARDSTTNDTVQVKLKIVKGAGSYVCGEESALLSSLEGQRPEVRIRPPYPAENGLFLKPTVVNNVETLANLAFIAEHGSMAFTRFGTEKSSGTKLMCLDSLFNAPGILEVEMGTPLSEVVYHWGKGFKKPVKALQIGGPLGGVVPVNQIDKLTIDFESFRSQGFDLGHASIVSIPEDFPLIKYMEHLFEFTANESCGKCIPCRIGTQRGKELVKQSQRSPVDMGLLKDLLDVLEEGSLCGLGKMLPLPVNNILHYFHDEISPNFND